MKEEGNSRSVWTDEDRKEIDEAVGTGGERRLKRFFIVATCVALVTISAFKVASSLYPSESRLIQVAGMLVQLSGVLIGFVAVATFYLLGTINSLRVRNLELRSLAPPGPLRFQGKSLPEKMPTLLSRMDQLYKKVNEFLVDGALYAMGSFGAAAILAMLSVVVVNDIPLTTGIGLVLGGITALITTIVEIQKMLNLIYKVAGTTEELVSSMVRLGGLFDRKTIGVHKLTKAKSRKTRGST